MAHTPMTEAQLKAEISNMTEELDPADAFGAIMIVADALGLDLGRVIAKIKLGHRLDTHEYIIEDILSSSQSNLKHSLYCAHRAWYANELVTKMEDEGLNS